MKKLLYMSIIAVLLGCSYTSFSQKKPSSPKKIVFQHVSITDSAGLNVINNVLDLMIDSLSKDSIIQDKINSGDVPEFKSSFMEITNEKANSREEIVLELSKDTIWRYTMLNNKMIGDFERIDHSNIIYHHFRVNRQLIHRADTLFKKIADAKITYNKADTKHIQGFDCYKVKISIEEPEDDEFPIEMGATIYEMYVTDLIKLPAHAIVYLDKYYSFFPLEVKVYNEKAPGVVDIFEATLIDR